MSPRAYSAQERASSLIELVGELPVRQTVDRLPLGAATIDRAGTVLFANAEFARLAGRAGTDMVGSELTAFVHPDDRGHVGRWFDDGIEEASRHPLRLGVEGRWATTLAQYWSLGPTNSGIGLVIASDISAQLQAESEARIRGEILDTVDAAIVAGDLDGRIIEWNKGAEELYGVSRAEALGARVDELATLPGDQERTEGIVEAVLVTGTWSGRIEATRPDGSPITAFSRNALIHDAQGRPSGMVGVAVDITGQLEAERDAIRARNYLNAVTDQLVEGIYVVDDTNGLTYMNAAAERLLGYSAEDLAGRNLHETVHYKHPDGSPYPIEDCPVTAIRDGQKTSHVEPEDTLVRADGSFLPVSYSASSFEAPDGTRGVSVVFRDITAEKAERDRVRETLEAMSWVGPIREALREDALLLHGQPIVDIATGEVVQQELLVRLPGKHGEPIAADRFLPAAEQFEMIGEIDRWVIRNAIGVAAALGESIQFNLSAASIQDPSTPGFVEEELARAGVDPDQFVLEVTESSLIRDFAVAERFANRLVSDGCALALDDFGTGFGGFTYLTRLNVSILKIDQSFVCNMLTNDSSRTVVRAVVGLANEFGLTTIAEGVEDAETLEMLGGLGVEQAQGYYLGRPGPLTGLPPEHKFRTPPGAQDHS